MENTIQFIRGDTYVTNILVKDAQGIEYVPSQDDVITMTVRANDHRGEIVIQKKTGDPSVEQYAGGWKITYNPADTSGLPYKTYVYDIELNMSGVVKTVIPLDKFILDKEVTY